MTKKEWNILFEFQTQVEEEMEKAGSGDDERKKAVCYGKEAAVHSLIWRLSTL